MSLFRNSSTLTNDVTSKILAWGVPGAGKSYFALSAPDPAIIDFEHRASHQRRHFEFLELAPTSIREGIEAIREIAEGNVACKSVVVDSLSKVYQGFIKRATSMTEKGGAITDWPAVNRHMLSVTEPLFEMRDKNIICIARQVVRLTRDGRDFKREGVKMIGDEQRWPFDYDFVLHFADRGVIKVTKSMSPNLEVGTTIRGDLDFPRFQRLVAGEETIADVTPRAASRPTAVRTASAVAPRAADAVTENLGLTGLDLVMQYVSAPEMRRIGALATGMKIDDVRLLTVVASITGAVGKPILPDDIERLVNALKAERAA